MSLEKLDLSILGEFTPVDEDNLTEIDEGHEPFVIPIVKSIEDFVDKEEPDPKEPETLTEPTDSGETTPAEPEEPEVTESPNKLFAQFASGLGLMEFKEEEFEDTEEFLTTKMQEKKESEFKEWQETYKETLPEPIKELLNNYEDGVPLHELLNSEARISEYSSIKEDILKEDADLQKDVLKDYLINIQEYDEAEADKKIKKFEDNLLLEEESGDALKKLIKAETKYKESLIKENKLRTEEFQKVQEERLKQFEDSVKKTDEILPGIKVTDQEKKKIIDLTTKIVGKDKQGRPITGLKKIEMEDPDFLKKMAYVAGVLKFDFEPLKKAAATTIAKKAKETVDSGVEQKSNFSKVDIKALKNAVKRNQKQRQF